MSEKISVALCTFNGEKYIAEQIKSILNQTRMPDEIIICDDKSADNTVLIARDILGKSSVLYEIEINESNLGVIKNFEKAIMKCSGSIIFTSDQDDVWVNTKIYELVSVLEKNEDLKLVFSDAYLTDRELVVKKHSLWEVVNPRIYKIDDADTYLDTILKDNIVTGATMAFRKELLHFTLPFNEAWIHDYWLAVNAAIIGKIKGINKPLVYYRQHGENVIGVRRFHIFKKISLYIKNIKRIEQLRNSKYAKYCTLLSQSQITSVPQLLDAEKRIESYVEFWRDMTSLSSRNFVSGILLIFNKLYCGEYSLYYTGVRGAFRDFMYMIIRSNSRL